MRLRSSVNTEDSKTYLKHPEKADPCRMNWLKAVTCRRVIPSKYTNTDYQRIGRAWLVKNDLRTSNQ